MAAKLPSLSPSPVFCPSAWQWGDGDEEADNNKGAREGGRRWGGDVLSAALAICHSACLISLSCHGNWSMPSSWMQWIGRVFSDRGLFVLSQIAMYLGKACWYLGASLYFPGFILNFVCFLFCLQKG